MDLSFFARSLIIGFSVAAVVGPIGVLCIHRTLHRGFWYGLVTGLGAATADAIYGSIAAFGLTLISNLLLSLDTWTRLLGGLFLIYLGGKTLLTRPAEHAASVSAANFSSAYASTLFLTLTNPLTILSFAAIFAGLGVGTSDTELLSAMLIVIGVFLGSGLWWLLLAGGVSWLRSRVTYHWLVWVNRISRGIILLFGVFVLVSLWR